MTRRLLFLLGRTERDLTRWAIASDAEVLDFGAVEDAGGLSTITPYASGVAEVVALLPGEQVACRRMPTALKSAAKLKAAAAYLMEDELGEASDLLEVGAATTSALSVAFAAKAEVVRGWLAAFEAAGMEPDVLSADYLALGSSIDEATIIADRGRVLAAFAGVGFALERDLFLKLGPELFASPPGHVRVLGDEALAGVLPTATAVDVTGPSGDAAILREVARAVSAAAPPNFLQRRLFRRKKLAGAIGPWRRAAALAALLAGAAFASMIADGARFARAEARWTETAIKLHQQRFPDAAAEDPVDYARGRLATGGGEASFMLISARLAAAVEANGAVQVNRVRYDLDRGDYIVSIGSKSDAAVEAFKAELGRVGVAASDSGGFRRNGDTWSGDVKVRLQ